MQKPSRTQIPMSPTAGSAVSKSPSQARVMSPSPIAVRTWLTRPDSDSSRPQMMPGRDERDDLRQEQHRPGQRAQPAGRDPVDDGRGDQAEGHRDEAEEDDEPERVEERLDEPRLGQDADVVRRGRPRSPARRRPSGRASTGRSGRAAAGRTARTSTSAGSTNSQPTRSAGGSPGLREIRRDRAAGGLPAAAG